VLGYEPDGVATFIILGALYFIPTIIAIVRKMVNTGSVMVINFFLGWTLIGWIVALAMAAGSSQPRATNVQTMQAPLPPPPARGVPLAVCHSGKYR
jgi:Superinfection immunity protein